MEKTRFFFLSIIFLKITLAFNIPYQSLVNYDHQSLIIKVKNTNNETNYYSCLLKTRDCIFIGQQLFQKENENNNIFPDEDYLSFIWQYYNKNIKKFITFFTNSTTVRILPINKKISKVNWNKFRSDNLLIISGNDFYLFAGDKMKHFRLNKKKKVTISPQLKYLLYQNESNQFVLQDLYNHSIVSLNLINPKKIYFIDDDQLVFETTEKGFSKLWLYDIKSNNKELVFNDNFIIDDFLTDRGKIYFIGNKENPLKWTLYQFDVSTKNLNKIIDNVVYEFKLLKIKNFLITKITGSLPPQIVLVNLDNLEINRLNLNFIAEEIKLGEIIQVEDIYSVFLKPDNFNQDYQYDLIIWLHGGPMRQTSIGYHPYLSYGIFDYLLEQLRKEGKMILKIDYPGSWGYGLDYQKKLKNNIGKLDVESIVKVVNKLSNDYKIKNIFLIGNSYGGYLALKALYDYPEKFKGAITINAVTDWWELINNMPSSPFRFYFNGLPNKTNKSLYDQASLYLEPQRLKNKKILLVYGRKDGTIPFYQSLLFYSRYKKIADVQIKSYDDEGHLIIFSKNLYDLLKNIKELIKLD
jgi:dipeptidyl aminopeptidase/acylaminoacyl peptidase